MVFVISCLIFIIVILSIFLLGTTLKRNRINILSRLDKITELGLQKELTELDMPFRQRILIPFLKSFNIKISSITPKVMRSGIEQKLLMAGKPINPSASKWLLVKMILGLIMPIGIFTYIIVNKIPLDMLTIIVFLVLTGFLFYFPELYLMQLINKRKKEIEKTLPDILDLLTVSVEAGLSFDSAVNKLTEKMAGVIADEFSRTFHEIRIGKTRKEALINMSKRCNVSDLSLFISSVVQADELGIGISNVLRVQSVQMREKRRQRAQEKALKAPVKILFPLIFFIFPTIFVVMLGPSIIKFSELMNR